jgi:nitroimidazol reductase NimA-like FMN-containing flavoprotein (pyridoxamine 5'-phosphate oxidase superfamily)
MDDLKPIKRVLTALFESQRLAVVATSDRGTPYASLVAFAADETLAHIYFVTPRSTRKYAYLSAEERVAVMVNSSTNSDADFHRAVAVTAQGKAHELTGKAREAPLKRYLVKHPYLESFAAAPSCALIDVHVHSYYLVKNFQNVTEWHLTHGLDSGG